jgi:hypothetical protein
MWAMTGMEEQPPNSQHSGPIRPASAGRFRPILTKLAVIGFILGCVGVVVTLLLPKPTYEGRLVGQIGDVHVYAIPTAESEEELIVWRGGRKLDPLPREPSNPIQQFDLSSADRQAAGTRHPDLVIDGWSGGMHCCLTRYVFDGPTGNFIGKVALGGSGASRFVPLQRTDPFPAAFLAFDDVTLDRQSFELGAPLATIVVIWDGKRFSLYRDAMKATTPESHAPFLLAEAFQEAQLEVDSAPALSETGSKGDVAKALDLTATARRNDMEAKVLNPNDATSFAPITGFLNDYVYKGQADAGFAAVQKAHASTPEALRVALQTYTTLLRKSQWFDDLNRLNDGRLISLIDQIDTPATPTP